MHHSVLAIGDTDLVLAGSVFTTGHHAIATAGLPCAVIALVDLRGNDRHDAKKKLRALATSASTEARRRSTIRHLIFVIALSPRHEGSFERIASRLGTRLHADLEREKGRDVEVTFVDVSNCSDVSTLRKRLLDRCADPAGQHGVVVLDWDDIQNQSIKRAARDEYL